MLALIDGDVFKWRWAAAGEYDLYMVHDPEEDQEFVIRGKSNANQYIKDHPDSEITGKRHVVDPVENVLHSVKVAIEKTMEVCGCSKPRIFLGGKDNYRVDIYPDYKSSRADRERPAHQQAVVDYLIEQWGAEVVDGIEADDAMAMYQTKDTVICSPDKDMLQVPGRHYNFVSGEKKLVSKREGDFNLYTQVLTGDSTDDIPGIRGIGPVKAAQILEGAKSNKELLDRCLIAWKGDMAGLLLCARLVYLLRSEDDSFLHRKEVKEILNET